MLESTILAVGAALTCLAQNIYFESSDQSTIGQIAVAEVTLNRVADPRWPNDICSVVKQGITTSNGRRRGTYQELNVTCLEVVYYVLSSL